MCNVICESPRLILNVVAMKHFSRASLLVTPRQDIDLTYSFKKYLYSTGCLKGFLYSFRDNVTQENIQNFAISVDGEYIPIYLFQKCNKCILCRNSAYNTFAFRAVVEANFSTSLPLFVTLTYDNDHLPSCGVNKRDVQLFLKRLRKRLDVPNIRYIACAEYGSNTHRAHYHLLLYNFPSVTTVQAYFTIRDAWGQGFVYVKPIDVNNDNSIRYVCKYMLKDSFIPDGKAPTFLLTSRGQGGIGYQITDNIKDQLFRNPSDVTVEFTSRYGCRVYNRIVPTYYLRRIFPCLSVRFKDLYKRIRNFNFYYSIIKNATHCSTLSHYKKAFSDINFYLSDNAKFLVEQVCGYINTSFSDNFFEDTSFNFMYFLNLRAFHRLFYEILFNFVTLINDINNVTDEWIKYIAVKSSVINSISNHFVPIDIDTLRNNIINQHYNQSVYEQL